MFPVDFCVLWIASGDCFSIEMSTRTRRKWLEIKQRGQKHIEPTVHTTQCTLKKIRFSHFLKKHKTWNRIQIEKTNIHFGILRRVFLLLREFGGLNSSFRKISITINIIVALMNLK